MLPAISAAMPAMKLAVAVREARHGQHDRERREHFHQAGVVIVIDVGAVDPSTLRGGPISNRVFRWAPFPGARRTQLPPRRKR